MRPSPAALLGRLRLRAKLVLTVFTATIVAIAGGAFLTIRFFEARLVATATRAVELDLDELRAVLVEDMLTADRNALRALVSQIGQGPGVAWVGLVDGDGRVKISSDRAAGSPAFAPDSPEHERLEAWKAAAAPPGEARSRAYVRKDCNVLRVMAPIANTEACWRCHDRRNRINGMLIIDRSLEPLRQAVDEGTDRIALGGLVALLLVLGSLGLVVERSVLARLDRLRRAASRLGAGELDTRAGDPGGDELADLAREFDAMASRLEAAMNGLAAGRRQLDQLVNGIADGVLLVGLDGRVVTANRAFAARVPGDLRLPGTPYREVLRAAGVDEALGEPPAERALASGGLEKSVLSAGGGERFEELYAQPLADADGRATAVIEVWRDVTDRKRLEASVEQSERLAALGVLASSVAHEVGNPLASIVTAVDGLLARLPRPAGGAQDEVRDYLEIVRRQVFRCRGATERLLGFARVPSGGRDAVVDVARASREVAALIAPQAEAQAVGLQVEAERPMLALAPDMVVEQVLLNLVLNALKAMPSGGTLRVAVEGGPHGVRIAVADSGPGIPPEMARHLFQPFRTSRSDGRGTGLGLFISQTLVERSGGRIEVRSEPGRGATFLVHLRRAPGAPRSGEAHAAEAVP